MNLSERKNGLLEFGKQPMYKVASGLTLFLIVNSRPNPTGSFTLPPFHSPLADEVHDGKKEGHPARQEKGR